MSLDVYLHGKPIGALFRDRRGRLQLRLPPGGGRGGRRRQRSCSATRCRVREEPYGPDASRAYVEGLLPQGAPPPRDRPRARHRPRRRLRPDRRAGAATASAPSPSCPRARRPEPREVERLDWLTDAELEEVLQPRPSRCSTRSGRGGCASPCRASATSSPSSATRRAVAGPGPSRACPAPTSSSRKRPSAPASSPTSTPARSPTANWACPSPIPRSRRSPAGPAWSASASTAGATGPTVERLHQESFAQALGIAPDDAEGRLVAGHADR